MSRSGVTAGTCPTGGTSPELVDRGRRLFEFLAAAQRLRAAPVRTTEPYERDGAVFWLGELPQHPAVTSALGAESPAPDTPFLTVRRVPPVPAPDPEPEVQPWLDGVYTDPEHAPDLRTCRAPAVSGPGVEEQSGTLRLRDHPEISAAYLRWRSTWDGWARQELSDRPVRALYRGLFAAHTTGANETEEFELVLGVGCLAWAPEQHDRVRRHVLVTPAGIALDESTGTLSVRTHPTLDALGVETDMLDPVLAPSATHLADIVRHAREQVEHPLDRSATGDLLRRFANSLDADARYDAGDTRPVVGATPVVAFAPAVLLRRRSRLGLVAVFERIAATIAETGAVPSGLLPLLDPDHRPSVEADPTPGAMVDVDGETFLPLPLNESQLDIIRSVDRQAQTLVQGPPGTGKTHLAAALISHLLAQGRRVLVTAHTDRALKEVRGKLPEAIKPLAVAVVGTARSDMADLRVAVERISSLSGDGDPEALDVDARARADTSLRRVQDLRLRRSELRERLLQVRAAEVTERSHAGRTGTLAAISRTYREHAPSHEWLLAHVRPGAAAPAPVTGAEAAHWLGLLRDRGLRDDEPEAARRLVDLATVPTPERFAELLDRQAAAESGYGALAGWTRHPAFERICALDPDQRVEVRERMTELARQITAFEQRRAPWMPSALADIRTGRAATWYGRAEHVDGLVRGAWAGLQHLDRTTRVVFAQGTDRSVVASLARYLLDHVRASGPLRLNPDGSVRIGPFTHRAVRNSRPLFDAVRVDDRVPATVERLTAVLAHLDVEHHLVALDQAWPADVSIPHEDTLHERVQWHVTELQQLRELLALGDELGVERGRLDRTGLPHPDWTDLDTVLAYAGLVDAAAARDAHLASVVPLQELRTTAAAACAWSDVPPACAGFLDAVRRRDRDAYGAAHARMLRLHSVRQRVAEREALTARVAAVAPSLAQAVTADPDDDRWTERLPALVSAWDWARTGAWILGQDTEDANALQQRIDAVEGSLRDEIERLAGVRAWGHALGRLTGRARADLSLYVRLVQRLGKGTSVRYGAARRAEVRQAMDRCRPAVPVWIMPIYRIAEQLHVTENMFDVVVVDEASQAGLEATFLQYLAPKIVVIGDDKQVSPSAVGVDQQMLRDLAARYLPDDRYRASWQDPKLSLFDAASIWFGARRTLVEHRRCVPEIIGFCNRIAYEPDNIRLLPVRQFGSDRLEPIRTVRVPDGCETGTSGNRVNRAEADAIIAQVEKCLADPRYDGRTFGVISLLGPRQAKIIHDALLERVPPEEWHARDLRCGDAAAFQGSERDVVFLSMVSAPEAGRRMGSLTLEANVQRYNVAVSRARDQLWVFHSVGLEQLTNSEDMRFQLLDYCQNGWRDLQADHEGAPGGPVPEDRRVEPFASLFEQRVHNRVVERGHVVVPQYLTMGYRIDLVVVGARGRLAVQCDGDFWHGPEQYLRDLARERDLRRCGWEFFRIRESVFHVDEHAALAGLWSALDELGIQPGGGSRDDGSG